MQGVGKSLVNFVRTHLAEVLGIFGGVEIGIFRELEAHIVLANGAAVGDGDFDALAGLEYVLAEDIIFPVVHAGDVWKRSSVEFVVFLRVKTRSSAEEVPADAKRAASTLTAAMIFRFTEILHVHNWTQNP